MIKKWHDYRKMLLKEDSNTKELEGLHLGREMPDRDHLWSIDRFGKGLCWAFIGFWILWLATNLWGMIGTTLGFWILWLATNLWGMIVTTH